MRVARTGLLTSYLGNVLFLAATLAVVCGCGEQNESGNDEVTVEQALLPCGERPFDDDDRDGVPNDGDNCCSIANPDQLDSEQPSGDGLGDACDPDDDDDGVTDTIDNCVLVSNANQQNNDGDSFGNACDNCLLVANDNQYDFDDDAVGDACDCLVGGNPNTPVPIVPTGAVLDWETTVPFKARDVVLSPNGKVYATLFKPNNGGWAKIQVLDEGDGALGNIWTKGRHFAEGIAVDLSGDLHFVARGFNTNSSHGAKIYDENGSAQNPFIDLSDLGLRTPYGIDELSGDVYVTDRRGAGYDNIHVLRVDGPDKWESISSWDPVQTDPSDVEPVLWGIEVVKFSSSETLVYVVDNANSRVQVFNAASLPGSYTGLNIGDFSSKSPLDSALDAGQELSGPTDVDVDVLGNVFVVDSGNNRIQVYDKDGHYAATIGGLTDPRGIDVVQNKIYVAEKNSKKIKRFTIQYSNDDDGDLVCNAGDTCPLVADFFNTNNDHDAQGDACDDDDDNDGVLDDGDGSGVVGDNTCNSGNTVGCDDNCRLTPNPDQTESDGGDIGDACDWDDDDDNIIDNLDNCPLDPNNDQLDSDGDGQGDSCDNCPNSSNASQSDSDDDGVGDVCDQEPGVVCGDGVCEGEENCVACPNDCGSCSSDCCLAGGEAGCAELSVQECVCAIDSFCCANSWDNSCVAIVVSGGCGVCTSCTDSLVNGNETDVDCGGPECASCANEQLCQDNSDCSSGWCVEGVCLSSDPDDDSVLSDGDGSGVLGDSACAYSLILDCDDNCPFVFNPDQFDSDEDGIGDACDNCSSMPNTAQADYNSDGFGDVCDVCLVDGDPETPVVCSGEESCIDAVCQPDVGCLMVPVEVEPLGLQEVTPTWDLSAFVAPHNIALAADGKLYVTSASNIEVFDASGIHLPNETIVLPGSVASHVAVEGERLYVSLSGAEVLLIYNMNDTSAPERTLAVPAIRGIDVAVQMGIDPSLSASDEVYVISGNEVRVYISDTGTFMRSWMLWESPLVADPGGIALFEQGESGVAYIADSVNGLLYLLDPYGYPTNGDEAQSTIGPLPGAVDVAVSPRNHLFVLGAGGQLWDIYEGTITEHTLALNSPLAIEVSDEGDVYILETGGTIRRFKMVYANDNDGDALCDGGDNCPNDYNVVQADHDEDGQGDVCDDDDDNDTVSDADDNCPSIPNSAQIDTDADGIGDACGDDDEDGLANGLDNCPLVANVDQDDADLDGIGDVCDDDNDNDGFDDVDDNCPWNANVEQADTDQDAIGDVCDDDDDNDGLSDTNDNCPTLLEFVLEREMFADTADLTLSGDAAVMGDVLRLVPDQSAQRGNAFVSEPLEQMLPLRARFDVELIGDDVSANGLSFILHSDRQGAQAEGFGGGGVGYGGITNSVAVVFKTSPENVVAVVTDGDAYTYVAESELDVGTSFSAWLDYEPATTTLRVFVGSSDDVRPSEPLLNVSLDLTDHLDGDRYFVGFGAATSDGHASHDIVSWTLSTVNANQTDTDGDGAGDVCDEDDDNDGVLDATDICVDVYELEQLDSDGDGIGDACDNCVHVSNANQADLDADLVGDACSLGQSCTDSLQCPVGACLSGVCSPSSCGDAVLGGTETDIDCGGECAPCASGAVCLEDSDCEDAYCDQGTCAEASYPPELYGLWFREESVTDSLGRKVDVSEYIRIEANRRVSLDVQFDHTNAKTIVSGDWRVVGSVLDIRLSSPLRHVSGTYSIEGDTLTLVRSDGSTAHHLRNP